MSMQKMKDAERKAVELMIKKLNAPDSGLEQSRDYGSFLSLSDFYKNKGFLTEKQVNFLTDIFERN